MKIVLWCAAAAALPGCAWAQSASSPSGGVAQLGEIMVTAPRENVDSAGQVSVTANAGVLGYRDQFDTPFSQASYTDKLIQDQQARTLDEVLENNSSIRNTANSYSDAEQLNIRGFSSQPQSVLFNGVPGLLQSRRPPIEGVERVDILLGPSALLYNGIGDQNVGGVINVQPKRADDAPINRVIGSYVSDSSYELQGDVGRRFGPDKTFGVRVNAAGLNGDTPLDHQSQRMGVGQLALDARTDRVTASLDMMDNRYRLLGNRPALRPLADSPIPRAPDASTNPFDESSSFREHNVLSLARLDVRAADWLTIGAAYGYARADEYYSGPYSGRLTDPDGAMAVNVIPFYARARADVGQLNLRASFATGPLQHDVALSGDLYSDHHGSAYSVLERLDTNLYAPVPLAPRITQNPAPDEDIGDNSRSRRTSVAIADVVTALDGRLLLIGGVRRQSLDDRNLDSSTAETTDRFKQSANTPAGAVMYKLTPAFSIYANYIQALQSGPTAPGLAANAGQTFAPFKAKQYEAGVKWNVAGLGLTAAVFQITQPSAYINASNVFVVDGQTRNRGVELNAFGSLVPGLRVLSGLSYFDPIQVRTGDAASEGKLAIGIPHWQANLGGEWDMPGLAGVTLTAKAIATSREYVDARNTQHIPGWVRYDAGARYVTSIEGRPWTFRLQIVNLTGRDRWQDASQGLLYEAAPRTLRASVAVDL
ncbi:TonB-dependent receptor [Luteibacter yeojuensis]|uniref:Iron complex outermembrane receptor protein n=1 Tax=Luteibacter yeojuensis TaxID=345309 RepID=A0A0F3KU94_9GAMM|nr:TonB-dependent siderophore receptor [Luteibacter yeojuensis]KJV34788.1 hypothetical protein VI08_09380 [Luteibacter yeojuensis]